MDRVRLLAFDTATEQLSVALVDGARAWHAHEEGGARASQRLLPAAFELLAQAGLRPADLDAVAFGQGPGAFTGLRTACSVAQGLALGLERPLLPLDSLRLVADDARERFGAASLWVVMDARMDEVYAAAYRFDQGRWQVQVSPALLDLPALHAAWSSEPPVVVAGSALDAFGARLDTGTARRLPDAGSGAGRAQALGRLGLAAWREGAVVDAADALPLYLRDKVALTTAERAAQRAGAAA